MPSPARLWIGCFFFLVTAAASGCQVHQGGRMYASPAWEQNGGASGKVLLLVCPHTRLDAYETRDTDMADLSTEISTIATDVLCHLPHTTVIHPTQIDPISVSGLSDDQAVALGRKLNADSVCILNVGNYGTMFAIALNPLPECIGLARALYSLRLVDVHTGQLLATSVTDYTSGGPWQIRTRDDLKRDLQKSLQADLAVRPRNIPSVANPQPPRHPLAPLQNQNAYQ